MNTRGKKRFFKVFKVAGKKCVTTVKPKFLKKRVNEEVQMTMLNFNNKVLSN